MDVKQLEAECMKLSDVVDTEVVEGDPQELSTFDATTLYVWLVPENSGGHEPGLRDGGEARMVVRGRYGERDDMAQTVTELARKLQVRGLSS